MDTEKVRNFLKVVNYGSFNSAADHLYLTPRAISKQIRQLEDELGITLFKREKNGIILTADGNAFLPIAKEIINNYNQALLINLQHTQRQIKIGYCSAYQGALIASILGKYRNLKPSAHFVFKEDSAEALAQQVITGAVDLAAVPDEQHRLSKIDSHLATINLMTGEWGVGISRSNPLSTAKKISLESLTALPLLHHSFNDSDFFPDSYKAAFGGLLKNCQMQRIPTLEQRNLLIAFDQGFGLFPLPLIGLLSNPQKGLIKYCQIADNVPKEYQVSLLYNSANHTASFAALKKHIKEQNKIGNYRQLFNRGLKNLEE